MGEPRRRVVWRRAGLPMANRMGTWTITNVSDEPVTIYRVLLNRRYPTVVLQGGTLASLPCALRPSRAIKVETSLARVLPTGFGNEPLRNVTVEFNDESITFKK